MKTLDYPIYGLRIEKIKFAYRSLYLIFDPLASDRKEKYDLIAFSISYEEFVEAELILILYVREAITLTSLAIHQVEVRKRNDAKILPIIFI